MQTLQQISIRPWDSGDSLNLVSLANNKNISCFLTDRFPNPYTIADAENWIRLCSNLNPVTQMAITFRNELAGSIGANIRPDIYKKTAELGFWLGEHYWNRGIATEAVKEFCAYCFEELQMNRISARVFEENISSTKVLQKAGFQFQCVLRKEIIKNEIVHDALLFDLIR